MRALLTGSSHSRLLLGGLRELSWFEHVHVQIAVLSSTTYRGSPPPPPPPPTDHGILLFLAGYSQVGGISCYQCRLLTCKFEESQCARTRTKHACGGSRTAPLNLSTLTHYHVPWKLNTDLAIIIGDYWELLRLQE